MIPEQWVTEIINRWPYKNNLGDGELEAIRTDLVSFSYGKKSQDLERILTEFRTMKPPRGFGMWWFYQQMKGTGGSSGVWWRICENGHIYQHKGTCCPTCGSTYYSAGTGESYPSETIMIQSSCSQCAWYDEDKTNPVFGLYGPPCNEYGTEKRGTVKDYCNRCKCKGCCDMAYLYRNNPAEYRKHFGEMLEKKYKETGLDWAQKA